MLGLFVGGAVGAGVGGAIGGVIGAAAAVIVDAATNNLSADTFERAGKAMVNGAIAGATAGAIIGGVAGATVSGDVASAYAAAVIGSKVVQGAGLIGAVSSGILGDKAMKDPAKQRLEKTIKSDAKTIENLEGEVSELKDEVEGLKNQLETNGLLDRSDRRAECGSC